MPRDESCGDEYILRMSIAVVVLTHNRLGLLRQCVENVLMRTSEETTEIVIWDQGSTDGTSEYLQMLDDPRLRIVATPTNVGMVAYGRAIAMTKAPYVIQLDDDVINAPERWDAELLSSFRRVSGIAWLAADLEDDPTDRLSNDRHRRDEYVENVVEGVRLLEGKTGGWCTMTSRVIYDEVGGLPLRSRQTYFSTDTIYTTKVLRAGYRIGILADLRVRHSGDRAGEPHPPHKEAFYRREDAILRRKRALKVALLAVPGVRALNRRHSWFDEPGSS